MNKEETMLQKRLIELSQITYRRDIVTFSDFLNLNELHILHSTPKNLLSSRYETFGGYEYAERQMVAFLPDALYYEYEYPICVLCITPINIKYAEDLTHRDYLGAILNLGIERCRIGDLAVQGQNCFVFCQENMANYITEQLTRIRHTVVTVVQLKLNNFSYKPDLKETTGTVASVRLDAVPAIAFPISRSKLVNHIEGGKVFVNGKLITNNGYRLKENDIISVRGMGRIIYGGILSETRKGRYLVKIYKY
ncbi:MAG: YlmH/Sll1252 family protein [Eubacteriales bacterium]|nr:YlmH/Sll1252 family protein [Eubacteriales bacterium]